MITITKTSTQQTAMEEKANVITHGIGVVFGFLALILLLIHSELHGDTELVVSVCIYGISLILLYSASMMYHAVSAKHVKAILQVLDHSCVYILIAGTYTPFMLISLGGFWGWFLFSTVWLLAFIGVIYEWLFFGRWPFFSMTMYIGMGWLALVVIHPLIEDLPLRGLLWLLAGGVCYMIGTIFFSLDDKVKFFHAIWHMCVLAGSSCHFVAILYYVKIIHHYQ